MLRDRLPLSDIRSLPNGSALNGKFVLTVRHVMNVGVAMEQRVEEISSARRQRRLSARDPDATDDSDFFDDDLDDDEKGKRVYSRRMLKLEMVDASGQTVFGIEYAPIDLSYDAMGKKIVLNRPTVRRGLILLQSDNIRLWTTSDVVKQEDDRTTTTTTNVPTNVPTNDDASSDDCWSDSADLDRLDGDELVSQLNAAERNQDSSQSNRPKRNTRASMTVVCSRCTFENAARRANCEMCDGPLSISDRK